MRLFGRQKHEPWQLLPKCPLKVRINPIVVCTGSHLIMRGGYIAGNAVNPLDSSVATYDIAKRRWSEGTLSSHVSVEESYAWSGLDLLCFGRLRAAGGYNLGSNTWRSLARPPIEPRIYGASVWTGQEWLLWGGSSTKPDGRSYQPTDSGAAYNPDTDTWRCLAKAPIAARSIFASAWTGQELFVFGGIDRSDTPRSNGAMYAPSTDTWRKVPIPDAKPQGCARAAVVVGSDVVVWWHSGDIRAFNYTRDEWRTLSPYPFDAIAPHPKSTTFRPEMAAYGRKILFWQPAGHYSEPRCALLDLDADTWQELDPGPLTTRSVWPTSAATTDKFWLIAGDAAVASLNVSSADSN